MDGLNPTARGTTFAPFVDPLKCVGWPCCRTARGFGLCAASLDDYDEPDKSEVRGVQSFCANTCACDSELTPAECNDAAGGEYLSAIPARYAGIFNAACGSEPTTPCCDGYDLDRSELTERRPQRRLNSKLNCGVTTSDTSIIESGRCGDDAGKRCSATGGHPCCSDNNWCGSTGDHCKPDHIQEDYSFARWGERGANLLSRTPFLMTHDSGSVYLPDDLTQGKAVKLHRVSTVDQLNCGARVLDARLRYNDKSQQNHYHHGNKDIPFISTSSSDRTIEDDLQDDHGLISWAKEHPDELAILYVSHCERPRECYDPKHTKPFEDKNLLILNYVTWHHLSAKSILAMSKEQSGHGLIVLLEREAPQKMKAVDEMWEKDVCYRRLGGEDANQKMLEEYKQLVWTRVRQSILGEYDLPLWKPWSMQHFYQQGDGSLHHFYQLRCMPDIMEKENAHLTKIAVEQAKEGKFVGGNAVNLLEINHICMYGLELAEQISKLPGSMTRINQKDRDTCIAACGSRFRAGRCSSVRSWTGSCELNWDECTMDTSPKFSGWGSCSCECVKKDVVEGRALSSYGSGGVSELLESVSVPDAAAIPVSETIPSHP